MCIERKRYDITAADTKIIGTDYQFFYFIKELLKMKKGQKIGYEVKDDVHIDLSCGKLVLIQLKHTTQKQSDGNPIELLELHGGLLHTLHNWVLLICDVNDGRNTYDKQKKYIENTSFILATNKLIDKNPFILKMIDAVKSSTKFDEFFLYLDNLLKKVKGNTKIYIESLFTMNRQLLQIFVASITIEVQADTIIDEIRDCIAEKYINSNDYTAKRVCALSQKLLFTLNFSFLKNI